MTIGSTRITTLLFDVDDTLYDVGTGFTAHRNGEGAESFMVGMLNFPDRASAKVIRDKYFEKYHSTAKALTVAEAEGVLPPPPEGKPVQSPRFRATDLAEWWATNLKFEMLGGPKTQLIQQLKDCPLQLVAFSNGPRKYVRRVLMELGLFDFFGEDGLFAVDDVLPFCKPEREAFQIVFDKVGIQAEECVLIEDSMKNIRKGKELGLKTVLVTGKGRKRNQDSAASPQPNSQVSAADAAEATKPGDAPVEDDPAVDVCIETVEELQSVLPSLWQKEATFEPISNYH